MFLELLREEARVKTLYCWFTRDGLAENKGNHLMSNLKVHVQPKLFLIQDNRDEL